MEHDGFSDKSEREAHDDWDTTANENGGRLTEESDMDQSDELSPGPQATAYVEQSTEEMAEVGHQVHRCVCRGLNQVKTRDVAVVVSVCMDSIHHPHSCAPFSVCICYFRLVRLPKWKLCRRRTKV